ncbi:hypothetical protein SAMN05720354_13327, partial [Nitrosospira sp. Nsp1]
GLYYFAFGHRSSLWMTVSCLMTDYTKLFTPPSICSPFKRKGSRGQTVGVKQITQEFLEGITARMRLQRRHREEIVPKLAISSLYGTLTLYSLPVSRRTSVRFFPFREQTPYVLPRLKVISSINLIP